MKFSLIMCTVGRTDTIKKAIESIIEQTYRDFELIIVDQNKDNVLEPILNAFSSNDNIIHIRSKSVGLSSNRNIGIKQASGEILAFPDDDCEYLPDTLEKIHELFTRNLELDFLTINIKGINSDSYFINKFSNVYLTRYNYKPYAISIGIFIRYTNKADVLFDELLGAGKYFGASEESDMIAELLELKYRGQYFGNYFVLHPIGTQELSDEQRIRRYKNYNLGFGALMKKEIIKRKKWLLVFTFLKELLGRFIGGIIPNKKRYLLWISFLYQIKGFIQYKI